jgi:hypothetical protein
VTLAHHQRITSTPAHQHTTAHRQHTTATVQQQRVWSQVRFRNIDLFHSLYGMFENHLSSIICHPSSIVYHISVETSVQITSFSIFESFQEVVY